MIRRSILRWVAAMLAVDLAAAARGEESPSTSPNGVALAIVFDTSASMRKPMRSSPDAGSKQTIGLEALRTVLRRLQGAASSTSVPPRQIDLSLTVFHANSATTAIPLAPFNAQRVTEWMLGTSPDGDTPLGEAIAAATTPLLASPLPNKHVIVITDGVSNVGDDPVVVIPRLDKEAEKKGAVVFFHFIAFDLHAGIFAPLEKLGVSVLQANKPDDLNTKLAFIIEQKVLVEQQ